MTPITGGLYKHYKGETYKVLGISTPVDSVSSKGVIHVARHTEISMLDMLIYEGWNHTVGIETLVVYQLADGGPIWARPLAMWNKPTDSGADRFTLLPPAKPKTPAELRADRFASNAHAIDDLD